MESYVAFFERRTSLTRFEVVQRSRELRNAPTEAELRLWKHLRNRQLGGYQFRRQHPAGPYILDFYCPEVKLAIELDGSQHVERAEQDAERTEFLGRFGIKVLRFWNVEVFKNTDGVLQVILSELQERSI